MKKESKTQFVNRLKAAYIAELEERGIFYEQDTNVITMICELEYQCSLLNADIAERGATIETKDGVVRNPSLIALNTATGIIDREKKKLCIGNYYRHRIGNKRPEKKQLSPVMQIREKMKKAQ